jgi:hypothetical protein
MMSVEATATHLMDQCYERFVARQVCDGMYDLVGGLNQLRLTATQREWAELAGGHCLRHPIRELLHQDPFTYHAFAKPRGYPGDAHLLEFIYKNKPLDDATPMGRMVYEYTGDGPAPSSVRARRDTLAATIDDVAACTPSARILSIACGHLREAEHSRAVMAGEVGEYIAFYHDAETLREVEQRLGGKHINTVKGSVRQLVTGKLPFQGLDLVYAAGLDDYLSQPFGTRLTRVMFDMLAPGGRLLVANFAPTLRDIGYMESFMAWELIYRDEREMNDLASMIPVGEIDSSRVYPDASGNIVYLEVTKS